jgi:MFS family permease
LQVLTQGPLIPVFPSNALAAPKSKGILRDAVGGILGTPRSAQSSYQKSVLPAATFNSAAALSEKIKKQEKGGADAGYSRMPLAEFYDGNPSVTLPWESNAVTARSGEDSGQAPGLRAAVSDVEKESSSLPSPAQSQAKEKVLKRYLLATGIYKIGMEALGLAVPLLSLTVFGSAAWTAVMAAGWGLSQAVFGLWAGSLLDRKSPTKVLSVAMLLESLVGGALLSLFMADKFFPALMPFPFFNPIAVVVLYSLAGGLVGMADVSRQVIPPLIIGDDEKGMKLFNARTHIAYEIAGVLGALLAGMAIKAFGLSAALVIHPPLYLLAAWVFSRILIPKIQSGVRREPKAETPGKKNAGLGAFWYDLKEGARTIASSRVLRWGVAALVLPLIVHRLFEGLLLPVFARSVLKDASKAAWMMTASNAGELIGAFILSRSMQSEAPKHSAFWVRLLAMGLLSLWALSVDPNLLVLLPAVALSRVTWAASDLSLRGKIQAAVDPSKRGRVFGLITAVSFIMIVATSLGVGLLLDAFPAAAVYFGVNIALTAISLLLIAASFPLNGEKKKA